MSDEPQKVAHDRAAYVFEGETNLPMVTSDIAQYWGHVGFEHGFTSGWSAGVAEGIRLAREAVTRSTPFGDGSYENEGDRGYRSGHESAARAVNALATDWEGDS